MAVTPLDRIHIKLLKHAEQNPDKCLPVLVAGSEEASFPKFVDRRGIRDAAGRSPIVALFDLCAEAANVPKQVEIYRMQRKGLIEGQFEKQHAPSVPAPEARKRKEADAGMSLADIVPFSPKLLKS